MATLTHPTIEIDGTTYTAILSKISRTHLGYEDHGIFTGIVEFDMNGSMQSNQAPFLDTYDESDGKRHGTAYGMDFIMKVVNAVGVDTWEEPKGQRVYVLKTDYFIDGICSIDTKRHFIFRERV